MDIFEFRWILALIICVGYNVYWVVKFPYIFIETFSFQYWKDSTKDKFFTIFFYLYEIWTLWLIVSFIRFLLK